MSIKGFTVDFPCEIGDTLFIIRYEQVCRFVVDKFKVTREDTKDDTTINRVSMHGRVYRSEYRWGIPTDVTIGDTTFGRVLFYDKKSAQDKLKGDN